MQKITANSQIDFKAVQNNNRWVYLEPQGVKNAWNSSTSILAKVTNAAVAIFKNLGALVLNAGIFIANKIHRLIAPKTAPINLPVTPQTSESSSTSKIELPEEVFIEDEPMDPNVVDADAMDINEELPEPAIRKNWTKPIAYTTVTAAALGVIAYLGYTQPEAIKKLFANDAILGKGLDYLNTNAWQPIKCTFVQC